MKKRKRRAIKKADEFRERFIAAPTLVDDPRPVLALTLVSWKKEILELVINMLIDCHNGREIIA